MRYAPASWFLILVSALFWAASSADATALPPGVSLLADRGMAAFSVGDAGGALPLGQTRLIDVEGMPFRQAMEARSLRAASRVWDFQLQQRTARPLAKGDVCLLRFWLRNVADPRVTSDPFVAVYLQKASPDWGKSVSFVASADREWREFTIPFVAHQDLAVGEAEVGIALAYGPQTIQIGGVDITSYGAGVKLEELPRAAGAYAGMGADAPWRAKAQQRIEAIRKGNFTVRVVDGAGRPVAGAKVTLVMRKHAFGWGSAVSCKQILSDSTDGGLYRQKLLQLFNRATPENQLKWQATSGAWGPYDRDGTLAVLGWLRQEGLSVRGHTLVWPSWRNMPPEAYDLRGDKAALEGLVTEHIKEMAAMTGGLVDEWDVLNEPWDNRDLMDTLGQDAMVTWFKTARAVLPADCRLYINDFGIIEQGDDLNGEHRSAYEETIRFLLERGAPVEGIGFQGHFGWQVTPPATLLQRLDRFAAFGLPLEITEFDMNVSDEEFQARYTRDLMTAAFSHPAVTGFVLWGFWEGAQHAPHAALFRKDWSIKPNGQAFQDLVFKEWWTDEVGSTAADGRCSFRGFLGSYEVTATLGVRSVTEKATIQAGDNRLEIRLPAAD